MKRKVQGIGINDADYVVQPTVNGKQVMCKYYMTWQAMLNRCYSVKYNESHPTYVDCTVSPIWHSFKVFKMWMEKQEWEGNQLDKDLLVQGNKVYAPNSCMFIPQVINKFVTDSGATRGEWPIGVHFQKASNKFQASCNNPLTGKQEHLGFHDCPNKTHTAWLKRKKELQIELADTITDKRIKMALLTYNFGEK